MMHHEITVRSHGKTWHIGGMMEVRWQSTELPGYVLVASCQHNLHGRISQRRDCRPNHHDRVNRGGSVGVPGIAGVDPDHGLVATERKDPVRQRRIAALPDYWPDVSDPCIGGNRVRFRRTDD